MTRLSATERLRKSIARRSAGRNTEPSATAPVPCAPPMSPMPVPGRETRSRGDELPRARTLDPDHRQDLARGDIEVDVAKEPARVRPAAKRKDGCVPPPPLLRGLAGSAPVTDAADARSRSRPPPDGPADPTTSSRAMASCVSSAPRNSAVTGPSRMTTTRSQCTTSSASRWLTRMTIFPCDASSCMYANRRSDCSSVSAEFGSSKRKKRAFRAIARAISARWRTASEQSASGRSTWSAISSS